MEALQPGWTNGVITLKDPVEDGWELNKKEVIPAPLAEIVELKLIEEPENIVA